MGKYPPEWLGFRARVLERGFPGIVEMCELEGSRAVQNRFPLHNNRCFRDVETGEIWAFSGDDLIPLTSAARDALENWVAFRPEERSL